MEVVASRILFVLNKERVTFNFYCSHPIELLN